MLYYNYRVDMWFQFTVPSNERSDGIDEITKVIERGNQFIRSNWFLKDVEGLNRLATNLSYDHEDVESLILYSIKKIQEVYPSISRVDVYFKIFPPRYDLPNSGDRSILATEKNVDYLPTHFRQLMARYFNREKSMWFINIEGREWRFFRIHKSKYRVAIHRMGE